MSLPRLLAAATLASLGLTIPGPVPAVAQPCATASDCTSAAQYQRQDDRRGRDEYQSRNRDRDRNDDRDRRYDRNRDRDQFRWEYERNHHWRTQRSPRHDHWVGQRLPSRGAYIVILDYWDYGLPRPRPGYAYVRADRDVFLIAEATKRIIDAFVLLEAAGH
jgi:Ni/Co efflux regulator RcnB